MFLFRLKSLFLSLTYVNFCQDFFSHARKRLDKKAKVNFKIHCIANWKTKNYNISKIKGNEL